MIKGITPWDLPDTIQIPDGYDMKTIPDITRDNIAFIITEHNKLVEAVNLINERLGIDNG